MALPKDAYYFSHDSNAQDDPKCMLLIDQLGMEGYGIFWALIERLRNEKDFKLPLNLLNAFAKRWNTSKEKIESVVKNYDLFQFEDTHFFSERLKNSMILKSERARISASYRWEMRSHSESNANGMQKHANKGKEKKEKKRGINFSSDKKKVVFDDGSTQKLGESQILELERGTLSPSAIFKGNSY